MKTVCIICPVGCLLEIKKEESDIIVKGNACVRGLDYGKSEYICPKRIVTALVRGEAQICSIKTTKPIEKTKINDVLNLLKNAPVRKYQINEVIYENIFNSGSDIIVTGVVQDN